MIEYPRHLHGPGEQFLEVKTDEEKAAALKAGWFLTPILNEAPEARPTDVPAVPGNDEAPKKRGRKARG